MSTTMTQYQLTNGGTILRLSDNAYIPQAPGNRDYREYKEWLAGGNTPLPAPEPPAPRPAPASADADLRAAIDKHEKLLAQLIPAGLELDAHVNDLIKQLTELRAQVTGSLNQAAAPPKDSGGHLPKPDTSGSEQFLALGWDQMVEYAKANGIDISVVTPHDEKMLAEFLAIATNLMYSN